MYALSLERTSENIEIEAASFKRQIEAHSKIVVCQDTISHASVSDWLELMGK